MRHSTLNSLSWREMMKLKADVQYYEFNCGCRVQRSELRSLKADDGTKCYRCVEHLRKLKHVCIMCPCGKKFSSATASRVRCDKCQREQNLKKSRESRKRKYHQQKKAGTLPVYDPKKKKKPKKKVDQTRRYECVHGDGCMNAECFRNVKFNCHNCKRFEKLERFSDIYSKENERYNYA